MTELPLYLLALALGYLLGSIPFGLLFTYASGGGDIRRIGSGNIGATNVLRTGKRWAAAATLICDSTKGAVAVLIAMFALAPALGAHEASVEAGALAGLGAFFGHVFPVWLGFKGGKGVATFIGILLAMHWPAALAFCALWLGTAAAFRISSPAALVAAAASPVVLLSLGQPFIAAVALVLAALIFWSHRENIARLRAGTEPRIGEKKAAA
jgi:glycerol-3-phosphate acyltransferase PlsY